MILKKSIPVVLTFALSASVIAFTPTQGSADTTKNQNTSVQKAAMAGGYTQQDAAKAEYQEMGKTAEKLMNKKYKNKKFHITALKKVYTQIVAGTNYKLVCEYKDNAGTGKVEIVIYKDLKGNCSLTKDSVIK